MSRKSSDQTKQTRREFCRTMAATTAGLTWGATGCTQQRLAKQASSPAKRPNLVFVFSDQQSQDMLGCYGNQDIITPNLDQMAAEGLRFNHCVSSSPVCTPFRGMLMSGQHPLNCGAMHNDMPLLANNGSYFGHVLRDAGYRMGYVGKWHLLGGDRNRPVPAGPMRYGFDGTFLTNNCHVDFRPGKCYYWNDAGEKVFFDEWEVYGQTGQALEFLDDCTDDEPFALFVSWHPPHDWGFDRESLVYTYDTMEELMSMYDRDKIGLRPSVEDTPAVRRAYHGYYGMCSGVDIAFGRLMDKLKQKGFDDNTLVVFTSDHGDNLNSYNYRIPKDHPEDTAARVPFLMRWPKGLPQAQARDLLLGPMDMMPTILGLMDLPVPDTVQGQDLSQAVVKGQDDAVESLPLFFFFPAWRGVYTQDVTYARGQVRHWYHREDGKPGLRHEPIQVLYDRRNDPHQLNNLYGDPFAADLQEKMEQLTQEWMARFNDPGLGADVIDPKYKYENGQWPQDTQEPGYRGRPVDVIKSVRT